MTYPQRNPNPNVCVPISQRWHKSINVPMKIMYKQLGLGLELLPVNEPKNCNPDPKFRDREPAVTRMNQAAKMKVQIRNRVFVNCQCQVGTGIDQIKRNQGIKYRYQLSMYNR